MRGKSLIPMLFILLVWGLGSAYVAGFARSSIDDKPLVVCTTTVLSSVVVDLAGDSISVDVISSPAVCPAHYDVKPSDVEAFRDADLILAHGFEPWVDDLKEASGSEAPVVRVRGDWNSPQALKEIYVKVSTALRDYLGINVSDRLNRALRSIDSLESWLKKISEENHFEGKPVVCMLFQKGFVSSLGFNIVAVYGPPEKVSAKQYEAVIRNATEHNAVLVIDNIQSGTDLGRKIASEIGAVEVALTNFPQTAPNLNNMTQVMMWNVQRITDALRNAELMAEVSSLKRQVETWRTAEIATLIVAVLEAIIIVALRMRIKR
ncbi:zinc ABC transporter substrate-binding protein [Candidatus Bathyarchaeota archaeon]|nr:zinc ABC transporter substrate-binding protein [Candidatus Bathyarchaeota archaeon]